MVTDNEAPVCGCMYVTPHICSKNWEWCSHNLTTRITCTCERSRSPVRPTYIPMKNSWRMCHSIVSSLLHGVKGHIWYHFCSGQSWIMWCLWFAKVTRKNFDSYAFLSAVILFMCLLRSRSFIPFKMREIL